MDKIIDILIKLNPFLIIPITIVGIIFVFNLITIISSTYLESRLLKKEWRVIRYLYRKIVLFLSMVLLISYLAFAIYYFLNKYSLFFAQNKYISAVLTVLSLVGFFYFRFFNKNNVDKSFIKILKRIYIGIFTSYIVIYIGINGISSISTSLKGNLYNISNRITSLLILFIVCSILFYFLIKPVMPQKYYQAFIYVNEDKWFLLHPLNKQEFIIGDRPLEEECTKIKIVDWNVLKTYEIHTNYQIH